MYEALEINTHELHPSMAVSNLLGEINSQLLIMFQFKSMIEEKQEDLEMLLEKEEQIKQLVSA